MSKEAGSRSRKSLILRVMVGILIIVLVLAIQVPKSQWQQQRANEALCQSRMENVYFATKFHHKKTRGYSDDLDMMLGFAEQESIRVFPPGFKLDRLTREESGVDSFQLEYYDPYQMFSHFEKGIEHDYPAGRDSVVLSIVPLDRFDYAPITYYTFASNVSISVENIDRGDQGIFTYVGAQGRLRGTQILGEPSTVPAHEYIYSIDTEDLSNCPATGTPFEMVVNVKIGIIAEMRAELEEETPAEALANSPLFSSLLVYRLLKESDAKARRDLLETKASEAIEDSLVRMGEITFLESSAATLRSEGLEDLALALFDSILDESLLPHDQVKRWDAIKDSSYNLISALKADSAIQSRRDELVSEMMRNSIETKFEEGIQKLSDDKSFVVVETGTITTTSDSITFYSDPDLIRQRLFKARNDKVTQEHLQRENIRELLAKFSFRGSYRATRVDSVGVTIKCPIEGAFRDPSPSLLERIFAVRGEGNHGEVENGDLSWSEKR